MGRGVGKMPEEESRGELLLRRGGWLLLLLLNLGVGGWLFGPLLLAPDRPAIAVVEGRAVLRSPDRRRRIFLSLAADEKTNTEEGRKAFPTRPWSQHDHRANLMHVAVRRAASRHDLSISEVYLIYEQGIRERWPGPDGKPLDASIVPLNKRPR